MGNGGDLPVIGFIGLGDMGGRMVRNLLKAGYTVHGFDLDRTKMAVCMEAGMIPGEDGEDVVKKSEVIMLSLPSSESFIKAAEEQLLPLAQSGQVFIELGTTVPHEIRRLAPLFEEKGAVLLDVPVSGWITGAESGTLSMWGGGDEATWNRCLPILEVLGDPKKIVYCGPSGNGQIIKGVHQLKSGLINAAYLEAIGFGVRAGVGIDLIQQVFGQSGGMVDGIIQKIKDGKGNEVGVKFRELPYYTREAEEQGFSLPITQTVYAFCDKGERVVMDDHRHAPAYWNELMEEGKK